MKPGRFRLLLGATGIVLGLAAATAFRCTTSPPDCGIADSVAVIDQAMVAGRRLWLVHRITGFHDKVEFVEIYSAAPVFDSCGHSPLAPLSVDTYDSSQGNVRSLAIRDGKAVLVYTRSSAESTELSKLRNQVLPFAAPARPVGNGQTVQP
jgi:hypothetical protein